MLKSKGLFLAERKKKKQAFFYDHWPLVSVVPMERRVLPGRVGHVAVDGDQVDAPGQELAEIVQIAGCLVAGDERHAVALLEPVGR